MEWKIHIANAQGQLDELIKPVTAAIEAARGRCKPFGEPLPIDVVVQVWPGRVIPERGFGGYPQGFQRIGSRAIAPEGTSVFAEKSRRKSEPGTGGRRRWGEERMARDLCIGQR